MTTSIIDWLEAIWKTDLPSNSKYVAAYLRTYMNAKRDLCWPSVGRISKETGLSEQTVRRHLRSLEETEWLVIERTLGGHFGETNKYLANIPNWFMDENFTGVSPVHPTPVTVAPLPLQPLQSNIQLNKQDNKQILDNEITDDLISLAVDYWIKKGVMLDAHDEWQLFTAHHQSKPNKKIKNYRAAWRTWYTNAVKFNKKQKDGKDDVFMRLVDKSWADDLT